MIQRAREIYRLHDRACEASLYYNVTWLIGIFTWGHLAMALSYGYFGWSKHGDPTWYFADYTTVNPTSVLEAYSRVFGDIAQVGGVYVILSLIGSVAITVWMVPSEQRVEVLEEEAELDYGGDPEI